jgi:hypothetical protein
MTATRTSTYAELAREIAAAVDAGTLDRESALYLEFLEAARERARGRDDDAAEHTTD